MDQASELRKIVSARSSGVSRKVSQKTSKNNPNHTPRVISVTSGKGGVGKTNIVGNLAVAFSKLGKKVLIFDADLGLANIDIIFGVHPEFNIGHVISGEKELSEVIVDGPEGIRIIPAGSGVANLTSLTEGQQMHLLSEFEALNDMLDIFLIDTGAGISSNVIYFNMAAEECIVVATGEPTSITDAYAMMKVMFKQHHTKYFKLLVNMVRSEEDAKLVYQKLSQVADRFLNGILIEYLGFIPNDDMLKMAVLNRKTVMELHPASASSRKFKKIADTLLKGPRRTDSDGNIKFFLKRLMDLGA